MCVRRPHGSGDIHRHFPLPLRIFVVLLHRVLELEHLRDSFFSRCCHSTVRIAHVVPHLQVDDRFQEADYGAGADHGKPPSAPVFRKEVVQLERGIQDRRRDVEVVQRIDNRPGDHAVVGLLPCNEAIQPRIVTKARAYDTDSQPPERVFNDGDRLQHARLPLCDIGVVVLRDPRDEFLVGSLRGKADSHVFRQLDQFRTLLPREVELRSLLPGFH